MVKIFVQQHQVYGKSKLYGTVFASHLLIKSLH